MGLQNETKERTPLLDERGRLACPSWCRGDQLDYNKDRLRTPWRRREWEFYEVSNRRFILQVYCAHTALFGVYRARFIDLSSGRSITEGKLRLFPGDSMDLDISSLRPHRFKFDDDTNFFALDHDGEFRRVAFRGRRIDLQLMFPDEGDAIVTATPFERRRQFHFGIRKYFLDLRGRILIDGKEKKLDEESFVLLNSGRGVWPRRNAFVWAGGIGGTDGRILALNLGWGLGRTAAASENALFVDGRIHKLDRVREHGDLDDFMKPELFEANDDRLALRFTPRFDQHLRRSFLLAGYEIHRVFGTIDGLVVTDEGEEIELKAFPFFCMHAKTLL